MKPLLAIFLVAISACSSVNDPATTPRQSLTIPPSFHGTWTHNASGIHPAGGENPWVISASTVQAHESKGRVRSVKIHGSNEITVIQEVSAEGTEYTEQTHFSLSSDGRSLEIGTAQGGLIKLFRVD